MFPLRGAREDCLKDNQTNGIERKKLLRLASSVDSRGLVKRISYLLIFFDVLNANGSRSYYSPLKPGSPAPLHNTLVRRGFLRPLFLFLRVYRFRTCRSLSEFRQFARGRELSCCTSSHTRRGVLNFWNSLQLSTQKHTIYLIKHCASRRPVG